MHFFEFNKLKFINKFLGHFQHIEKYSMSNFLGIFNIVRIKALTIKSDYSRHSNTTTELRYSKKFG